MKTTRIKTKTPKFTVPATREQMEQLVNEIVALKAREIQKPASGWAELYDIYLSKKISTPVGQTDTLRLCTVRNFQFFTPGTAPEPADTQGDPATYYHWPITRESIKAPSKCKYQNAVAFSNVTAEWAQMIDEVDWEGVKIIIRKVSLSIPSPTFRIRLSSTF